MNASFDREAAHSLRDLLSVGLKMITLGLLSVPSELSSLQGFRDAEKAIGGALDRLDDEIDETAFWDVARDLRDALASLAHAGFGPSRLCSLAWHGAQGIYSEKLRRSAEAARRIIIPQWARWLEDVLDNLAASPALPTKKSRAIRCALDILHEAQKFYGNGWDQSRELAVQAQIDEMLFDLARVGLGTIELEIELQVRPPSPRAAGRKRAAKRPRKPSGER